VKWSVKVLSMSNLIKEFISEVVVFFGNNVDGWHLRDDVVLVDKDLEEGVSQVALNVLLSALVLGCLLGVHRLRLVCLEVHFNAVHSVNTLLIPRRFFLENRA